MIRSQLFLCLLLLVSGCRAQPVVEQVFRDANTELTIHYPSGWTRDPESTTFTIESFRPALRPPQVLVPLEGARIVVSTLSISSSVLLAEWVRNSARPMEDHVSITEVSLGSQHFGRLAVTLVRDHPAAIPDSTGVTLFFRLDARVVRVILFYRGVKRAQEFEKALVDIVTELE